MAPPWSRRADQSIRPGIRTPSSGVRLDSQAIVHRAMQLLLAAEVPFRRLNRDVSEQELNLVQLSTEGTFLSS